MGLFERLKKKSNVKTDNAIVINNDNGNIIETSNYMLVDVKKDFDLMTTKQVPINSLQSLGSGVSQLVPTLETITSIKSGNNLYRVTNLNTFDKLNTTKKGITYGVVKKADGGSKLAQLKKVHVDPATIMMAVALYEIESQLNEIIDLSKRIFSFLERDKEAEIEADLETLNVSIREFKYNWQDKQYLANNHKHVMDIKRTAKKNMNFYKKQITDDILKNNVVVINQTMNSLLTELEKKFKYYRLSLYTYSYASYLEIMLLGNYQEDYLLTKKEELEALDNEYANNFDIASKFIQKNANKSLEGNLLKGIGTAGKAIGTIAEKVPLMKEKKVNEWFDEKSSNLSKSGDNIKNEFIKKFEEISESNTKTFINKVDDFNCIYNKTKEIYFDGKNIYLDYSE